MIIKDFLKEEIIIPSKGNGLSLYEVDFMFPHKEEIPLYPSGICWVHSRGIFRVAKNLNGKKKHILDTPSVVDAIIALENFCTKHNITP